MFADVSRRILASGAAASAIVLLDRVTGQLAAMGDVPGRAEALQTLLCAQAEANEAEHALRTAQELASPDSGLDSARRVALRGIGMLASQRRAGTAIIPGALRAYGVTPREYEVLELLVFRFGNKEIATRLHISPRTVEKHVASLLCRTGQGDRARLIDYATVVLSHDLRARLSQFPRTECLQWFLTLGSVADDHRGEHFRRQQMHADVVDVLGGHLGDDLLGEHG